MDKDFVLDALQKGTLDLQGQFLSGSNYTFLGDLTYNDLNFQVVYKPVRGEQPLWDFPHGSLARREVAAYLISEALGWNFVPPTIFRKDGPLGSGSLQQYIDHDPNNHYFNFEDKDRQRLRPVVIFDLLLNNADRKGGHILRDSQDQLWLIDHGLCFHAEDKLRTVVWDFSGEEVPRDILSCVNRMAEQLNQGEKLYTELLKYLRAGEVAALCARARRISEIGRFPSPPASRRSYPWPPV
ncbi:MAG: SCO1664 family protein [Anaerolineaceae bacterium]|nr:SCO1664 family protein [Anaerolineaceae bacterium]